MTSGPPPEEAYVQLHEKELLNSLPPPVPATARVHATTQQIRDSLQNATDRAPREYKSVQSLALHFQQDDTGAQKDVKRFKQILTEVCELPEPRELIMRGRRDAHESIEKILDEFNTECGKHDGRSLIVIYYAGHACKDASSMLAFTPDGSGIWSKTVTFQTYFSQLFSNSRRAGTFRQTDVLFILDCCEAGAALNDPAVVDRQPYDDDRVVEIVTAADVGQNASGAGLEESVREATFTKSLLEAAVAAREQGLRTLVPSAVVQDLLDARLSVTHQELGVDFDTFLREKRPPFCRCSTKVGTVSIKIPIRYSPTQDLAARKIYAQRLEHRPSTKRRADASSQSERADSWRERPVAKRPKLTRSVIIVAKVHSTDDPEADQRELEDLKDYLEAAPAATEARIAIAYPSASLTVHIWMQWVVWTRLCYLPFYQLVDVVAGPPLELSPPRRNLDPPSRASQPQASEMPIRFPSVMSASRLNRPGPSNIPRPNRQQGSRENVRPSRPDPSNQGK